MSAESRRTGIGILGDVPWGTHACLFYDTQQDLLQVLIPFIAAGLESNEACLWVLSEPFSSVEVLDQLRQSVPNVDRHLSERRLELIPHHNWYHGGDPVRRFQEKLESAHERGLAGLRATGDAAWLGQRGRRKAYEYEERLNGAIAAKPAILLCTYPLAGSGASELLDASRAHSFTAIVREGTVQILEQELRKQKEILQTIFDHIPVMISFFKGDRIRLVNREWERVLGWTLDEIRKNRLDIVAECYPDPAEQQRVMDFISNSTGEWADFTTRVRDGRVIQTTWAAVHLSDGTNLTIGRDTTERKKAEEQLKASADRLRALSASIQEAREEERTGLARLVHDELGSVLTSLKWDLNGLDQIFPKLPDPAALTALGKKMAEILKLVDSTIDSVRRIASELRPPILDDLGLVEAIEWQTQQFEVRTRIVCRRHGFSNHTPFNAQQSTAIFRIFQEALTNILRHAGATRVDITMARDNVHFILTIQDNGRGIMGVEKSGLGILGMQERARLIGGRIAIRSSEGGGTSISVRVPISGHLSDE